MELRYFGADILPNQLDKLVDEPSQRLETFQEGKWESDGQAFTL